MDQSLVQEVNDDIIQPSARLGGELQWKHPDGLGASPRSSSDASYVAAAVIRICDG